MDRPQPAGRAAFCIGQKVAGVHCSKVAARLAARPPPRPSARSAGNLFPSFLKPRADVVAVIVVVVAAAAVGSVTHILGAAGGAG